MAEATSTELPTLQHFPSPGTASSGGKARNVFPSEGISAETSRFSSAASSLDVGASRRAPAVAAQSEVCPSAAGAFDPGCLQGGCRTTQARADTSDARVTTGSPGEAVSTESLRHPSAACSVCAGTDRRVPSALTPAHWRWPASPGLGPPAFRAGGRIASPPPSQGRFWPFRRVDEEPVSSREVRRQEAPARQLVFEVERRRAEMAMATHGSEERRASIKAAESPCLLALSARKSKASPSALCKRPPSTADLNTGLYDYALCVSVFMTLRDDTELHRDQLSVALESLGVAKPNQAWILEVCSQISEYSTLNKSEFIRFVELYSARQLRSYKEAFDQFDSDHSGEIDYAELVVLLETFDIMAMGHVVREVLNEVDASGNGKLNFDEFKEVLELIQTREGFTQRECAAFEELFERFDRDASGAIDVKELSGILGWLGFSFNQERTAQIVRDVDIDGDCAISGREFLVCLRRIREAEIRIVTQILESCDEDGNGTIGPNEFPTIFRALGYEPDSDAVWETAADVGLDPSVTEWGLDEIWQVLTVYRQREGFSKAETGEITSAFDKYNVDKTEEVGIMEVCQILSWLGYTMPLEQTQELFEMVDVDCSGRVDVHDLQKVCRIRRARLQVEASEAFMKEEHTFGPNDERLISASQCRNGFRELGFVNDDGMPFEARDDDYTLVRREDAWRPYIDLTSFVRAVTRNARFVRKSIQDNYGFMYQEVNKLRRAYETYDKDGNGCLNDGEIVSLIEDTFPEMAHDKEMRPQLQKMIKEVDQDGSGTMEFVDFLHLMQQFRDAQITTKVTKERIAIAETGFTYDEVKEWRELFLTVADPNSFHVSFDDVKDMVYSVCHFRRGGELDEFRDIFDSATRQEDRAASNFIDFPEFIRVVQKLFDIDFAQIRSVMPRLQQTDAPKRRADWSRASTIYPVNR